MYFVLISDARSFYKILLNFVLALVNSIVVLMPPFIFNKSTFHDKIQFMGILAHLR